MWGGIGRAVALVGGLGMPCGHCSVAEAGGLAAGAQRLALPRVPPPHSGRVWGALDSLVPGIQSKSDGLESRPVREAPAAPCSGEQRARTNDSSYTT